MKGKNAIFHTLLMMLFISMLPMVGIVLYSAMDNRARQKDEINEAFALSLYNLAAQYASTMANARHTVEVTAKILENTPHSEAEREDVLASAMNGNSDVFANLALVPLDGKRITVVRSLVDATGMKEKLRGMIADLGHEGFSIGSVDTDPITGEPVFPMSTPVRNASGTTEWMLIALLHIGSSTMDFESYNFPRGTRVDFLGNRNKILYTYPPLTPALPHELAAATLPVSGGTSTPKMPLGVSLTSTVPEPGSRAMLVFLRQLSMDDAPDYATVRLTIPEEIAYSDANNLAILEIVPLLVTISAAFGVIFVLNKLVIAGYVNRFITGTTALGQGKNAVRGHRTQMQGDFFSLSRAFDEMASAIEQRNTQLLLAKQHADDANTVKSEFLSNMSHGIRTPLNSIIGMSYLALKSAMDPAQKSYVKKIYMAANSLQGIVNDILDFSKIESGTLSMERAPFAMETLLETVAAIISPKAEEKGLSIVYALDPKIPPLLTGDSLRLGQIMLNLLSNALKFTPKGEIALIINLDEDDGQNVRLHCWVKDSGIGMSRDQQKRLFEAFTQADGSITRKFGGTGLGLTITRSLLTMMSGEISVHSSLNEGTIIEFTAGLEHAPQNRRWDVPARKPEWKILILDPSPLGRKSQLNNLEALGYPCTLASTGHEASALLRQAEEKNAPFRLVFIEQRPNSEDSRKLCETFLRGLRLKEPPRVVITSTIDTPDFQDSVMATGASAFLNMPAKRKELATLTYQLLRGETPEKSLVRRQAGARHIEGGRADKPLEPHMLSGLHFLLVEDNPVNQQITMELLESAGAMVSIVPDGVEAVLTLNADDIRLHYDMVLMDLQMPYMDGFEATRRIREDSRHASLPIIALTAHVMEEDRQKCLDAGMSDHLCKPLDMIIFYKTILRWAGRPESDWNLNGQSGPEYIGPQPPAGYYFSQFQPQTGTWEIVRPHTGPNIQLTATNKESEPPSGANAAGAALCVAIPAGEIDEVGVAKALPVLKKAGLDTDQALKRLNGRTDLFTKLISGFKATYAEARQDYARAKTSDDATEPERFMHTLKGLAGNIGDTALAAQADAVVQALREGNGADEAAEERVFMRLETAVRAGSEFLSTLRAARKDNAEHQAFTDGAQTRTLENEALFTRLLTLAREGALEAVAIFQQHQAYFKTRLGEHNAAKVRQLLDRYDMNAAAALLAEAERCDFEAAGTPSEKSEKRAIPASDETHHEEPDHA